MKIVLLRHAARSPSEMGDSALNSTGKAQAERLAKLVKPEGRLPQPTQLLASPKKRARETLLPLSDSIAMAVTTEKRLDERHQNETGREFESRVLSLFSDLEKKADSDVCIYICTHLDWLETACLIVDSDLSEDAIAQSWSACEYRQFRLSKGLWSFVSGAIVQPGH